VQNGTDQIHAEIRRLAAEVRKLREQMEETLRFHPTRSVSLTRDWSGPPRKPHGESLAARLGRMKRG
jgi:hypothetical protein